MLTIEGSQNRLTRFRHALDKNEVELALIADPRSVYYLTAHLADEEVPQLLVVGPDFRATLVTNTESSRSAADETRVYQTYSLDWPITADGITENAAIVLRDVLNQISKPVRKVAIEKLHLSLPLFESLTGHWPSAEILNAGSILRSLRRRKDADEIAVIERCVHAIEAGFAVASRVVRPGATEFEIFIEIQREIVRRAGYNLKLSGDFACGVRAIKEGGRALNRPVLAGDLYIIDIYPGLYSYHGDLCRTFAASEPTGLQFKAWEICRNALRIAEEMIRPGVSTRDVWNQLRSYIDGFEFVRGSFWHHAGHGIGLEAQEFPWITPGSGHTFELGDVIAVEPGCYSEELQGGVRLEQDYVVHERGLENLGSFPLDLRASLNQHEQAP